MGTASARDKLDTHIRESVAAALAEDIGGGDLTGSLIAADTQMCATVITREKMTMAGQPWFDEVMRQVDGAIRVDWNHNDGAEVEADAVLCNINGPARSILTAERSALNFLQLLSAVATRTATYVSAITGTDCRVLDTRKTLPGLRLAQKYAVACGGGVNHRIGLFDAILIKENHIMSAGGITSAVATARALHPGIPIEVEVESLDEMREALAAGADRLMLDNFALPLLQEAVEINRIAGNSPAELEASGDITLETIRPVAETGVDFVSVGALTKHIQAIDLSMRFSRTGE